MILKEELDQHRARFMQTAPKELIEAYQAGVDELIASDIVRKAVKQGDVAPDITLPNAHGSLVTLSKLLAAGPVVLSFYRGGWCPYCNLQLHAYQRALPEVRALGASLVAVSPEPPDAALSTAEKNELKFEVLSDVRGDAARAFRILFEFSDALKAAYIFRGNDLSKRNADGHWHLPIPATYVIAPDRRVLLAYVDPEYRNRLGPEEIVAALRAYRKEKHEQLA